jgi:hypothetical protein
VRRPVASLLAAVFTEIYLCNVCSCQAILRRNGSTQCALICKSDDPFGLATLLDDLACPPKASCKPISTTAICTYDSR